eukprot:NODE_3_length_80033_cov_0.932970.p5 type:complete len:802 gc:universal NODE_3_length_80033_cov_0.932970:67142-64737(-)
MTSESQITFPIEFTGDGDEKFTLNGKDGCTIKTLYDYIGNLLLKYTTNGFDLLHNNSVLNPDTKVQDLQLPYRFTIKIKEYTEFTAKLHINRLSKVLQPRGGIFNEVLTHGDIIPLVRTSELIHSSEDALIKIESYEKSFKDVSDGLLFIFTFKGNKIYSMIDGFYFKDTKYSNLVDLLRVNFDVSHYDASFDDSHFIEHTFIEFQKYNCVDIVNPGINFESLAKDVRLGSINVEMQLSRTSGLSDDASEIQCIEADKNITMLQKKFKDLAVSGVLSIIQGGILPINPEDSSDKYIYVWNNLFFGPVGDWYEQYNDNTYHNILAVNSLANKEIEAISIFESLGIDSISTTMACLVKYGGKHYLVQAIAGNSFKAMLESEVVYGNSQKDQECDSFINSNELETSDLSKKLGFNLIQHSDNFQSVFLKQSRIAKCSDSKFYLSDIIRLTPEDAFSAQRYANAHTVPAHNIMYFRNELVQSFRECYSKNLEYNLSDNCDIISKYLESIVIPTLLLELLLKPDPIVSGTRLVDFMHSFGINVRYIGLLRDILLNLKISNNLNADIVSLYKSVVDNSDKLLKSKLKYKIPELPLAYMNYDRVVALILLLETEIAARSVKSFFVMKSSGRSIVESKKIIIDILNELPTLDIKDLKWRKYLVECSTGQNILLVKRICEVIGIRLSKFALQKMEENEFKFELKDFVCFLPLTKSSNHTVGSLKLLKSEDLLSAMHFVYGENSSETLQIRCEQTLREIQNLNVDSSKDTAVKDLFSEILQVSYCTEMVNGPFSQEALDCHVFNFNLGSGC